MSLLCFPVDNLGGRNGQGIEAKVLNVRREEKCGPIQEKVELAVMMKIKWCRLVFNFFQDGVCRSFSERNRPMKSHFYGIGQAKFVPCRYDIGYAKERCPETEAIIFKLFIIFALFRHKGSL